MYRAATFASKREAKDWAMAVESQLGHVAASGFAPVPKAATLGDLIDKYRETQAREPGRTKGMTLDMLKRELQPQPGDEYLDLLRDPDTTLPLERLNPVTGLNRRGIRSSEF